MGTRIISTSDGTNRGAFAPGDWGLFVSVALIWGSSFLFISIALNDFGPGLITWLRVASGAATLALVPRSRRPIEPEDRSKLLALSFLWVAIPFTLFPLAQQYINSSVTGMLNGATPIFAALIASLLLKRLPRLAQGGGLVLGLVGLALISVSSGGQGKTAWYGVVMVLVATLCYGIALNIATGLQQKYGSLPVMGRMLSLATIWVSPFGLASLTDSSFSVAALGSVLFIGVAGTGLAFVIMGNLSGRVGPTRASFITYLIPVVSVILGVVLLADEVTGLAVVGIGLVIVGAILASRREA